MRPLIVPQPVTTPSPGMRFLSAWNSVLRCSTNMSNSSNDCPYRAAVRCVRAPSACRARAALRCALRRRQARLAPAFFEFVDDLFHGEPAKNGVAAICGRGTRRSSPCQLYEFAGHFQFGRVEAGASFRFGVDTPFLSLKRSSMRDRANASAGDRRPSAIARTKPASR